MHVLWLCTFTAIFIPIIFSKPSNVILILTDDQDVVLGGLNPIKKTNKLIAKKGITFSNAFATTPICCPSRSSILTGLYLHSHKTYNNSISGGCSSPRWQKKHEPNTFGAILHKLGYRTFYAGKYLNQYGKPSAGGPEHIPVGWDWWIGLVGNSVYYNYTLSVNGSSVFRGDRENDYLTDVLKKYSLEFLKTVKEPFLMIISPPSPHEPFTPAKRHQGIFSGVKAPRIPNFNIPVKKTKHWLLRLPPDKLPQKTVDVIDKVYRYRWESLLAVDEMVEEIFFSLEKSNILNNTFVIFTSDHGFHLGQFGLPWDKRQPYETDIRIPLLIRGPNLPQKNVLQPVLNIDLAATILQMAKASSKKTFGDGISFLSTINSVSDNADRNFLVEYYGEEEKQKKPNDCFNDFNLKLCSVETSCKCFDAKNNTYTCLRRLSNDVNDIYCEFQDKELFEEFYDLNKDPYQLDNIANINSSTEQKQILKCCKLTILLKKPINDCFRM